MDGSQSKERINVQTNVFPLDGQPTVFPLIPDKGPFCADARFIIGIVPFSRRNNPETFALSTLFGV